MKKNNKIWIGLIAGLVCVVLCVVLVLTMCNVSSGDPNETTDSSETADSTEDTQNNATTEATDATEETTEATEETTEATEEATEATEATEETVQESTGSNNGKPGGTGGSVNSGTTSAGSATEPTVDESGEAADAAPIEVSAPGTQTNVYTESVTKLPGSFTTVNMSGGETMYYDLYTTGAFLVIEDADAVLVVGDKTYTPVDGVITVELSPSDGEEPLPLRITNQGSEKKAFAMNILDALGSGSNPMTLASIERIEVALEAGNQQGVYYTWTADASGTLKLQSGSDQLEIIAVNGSSTYKLSDSSDGILSLPVELGDEISIQMLASADETGSIPAVSAVVTGTVELPAELWATIPGSVETNPIPAGEAVYYTLYRASGAILTIEDADAYVVYNDTAYTPDENGTITIQLPNSDGTGTIGIQLGNSSDTAKTLTLSFTYPLGSYGNPDTYGALEEQVSVKVTAGSDGWYYTYTAEKSGVLSLRVWDAPEQENVKTDIVLTNTATLEQKSLWNYDEALEQELQSSTVNLYVNAGDRISIQVSVLDALTCYGVDAELSVYAEITGVSSNPIAVVDDGSDDDASTITMRTDTFPAGAEVYYSLRTNGAILTVTGEGSFTVSYNGTAYASQEGVVRIEGVSAVSMMQPAVICVCGEADGAYDLLISFPEGTDMNPAELNVNGRNTAVIGKGDEDGYIYHWTATQYGELTIQMSAGSDWLVSLNNNTTGDYNGPLSSEDDLDILVVEVSPGDEIEVLVSTYDPQKPYDYPAGEVSFFAYLHGTASDPYLVLDDGTDEDDRVITMNGIRIPGGSDFYFAVQRVSDAILTVRGEGSFTVSYNGTAYASQEGIVRIEGVSAANMWTPAMFCVCGETDGVYDLLISFPEGTNMNPAELTMGENTAALEEGDADGYLFTWTAPADGVLTLTMPDTNRSGWQVSAVNAVTYVTSETITSDGDTNTLQIEVSQGDIVNVYVSTYDPKNPYVCPEGSVVFEGSFQETGSAAGTLLTLASSLISGILRFLY